MPDELIAAAVSVERAKAETTLQAMRDPARWSEVEREVGGRGTSVILFDGEPRLWIAPSPIEGVGGFAARPYETGELILVLAGEACGRERRLTSRHVFRSGQGFIDAAEHWSGALNGSGPSTPANAEWRESGGIYALHHIQEGVELIISYGPAYWAMYGRDMPAAAPLVSAAEWERDMNVQMSKCVIPTVASGSAIGGTGAFDLAVRQVHAPHISLPHTL